MLTFEVLKRMITRGSPVNLTLELREGQVWKYREGPTQYVVLLQTGHKEFRPFSLTVRHDNLQLCLNRESRETFKKVGDLAVKAEYVGYLGYWLELGGAWHAM